MSNQSYTLGKKTWLLIELILIFVGLPILLTVQNKIIHPSIIILPLLLILMLYLKQQAEFKTQDLYQLAIPKHEWVKHILGVCLAWILLLVFVCFTEPENMFNLPKNNWRIWVAICLLYPVFSAYGQEVIFRLFMRLRYYPLLGEGRLFIIASALLFSFAHIIYFSPLSLILTFFAGLYLAWVYVKFRSVLFVSILHGLLGNAVFTLGLGQHFWMDITKFL